MKSPYYVYLSNVPGVEFDSTFARGLKGEAEGTIDVEVVFEAESADRAIGEAYERWGLGCRVEAAIRLAELELPRLPQDARQGDSTLGAFHRRGLPLEVENSSGVSLDLSARVVCLMVGRFPLAKRVELSVRPLGMPEAWVCLRCEQRHSWRDEGICSNCGWWDCGHRSTDIREELSEKCSNWLCLSKSKLPRPVEAF